MTGNADPKPAAGRQSVLDGPQEVLVHRVRLDVAGSPHRGLRLEPCPLVEGVGQLGERVRVLTAQDDQLEAFDEPGIVVPRPGQW